MLWAYNLLLVPLRVLPPLLDEFGVVLMIGGAIPGKTEVVSIRIYQLVPCGKPSL